MPGRVYYLWNIGCQMNRSDAQRIAEMLESRGYRRTQQPDSASLLVLNTCVVRQSAEDKVTGRLNSLKPQKAREPKPAIVVMGCFVGDPQRLAEKYPFVDAFLTPSDINGLVTFVDAWNGSIDSRADPPAPALVSDMVPISYGCDHHCTYCIVTIRRGDLHSRPVADIAQEVASLVARGAREITLLGQNVDAYGSDLAEAPDLADILYAIHGIPDLWRIRFLTSHPKEMSQRIIDAVAALPKVCECWELAVQSGDDNVLRAMARGYTVSRFQDLMRHIREATPDCAINTDIIVGYPGETDAQFANTLKLVESTRFDVVHVASYSPRPGTPAARLPDDVPHEKKTRRRVAVEAAQERIAGEINARFLGQEVEILVDGRQKGRWRGRTRTNKLVFFEDARDWLGKMVTVRINWTGPWSMIGEVRA